MHPFEGLGKGYEVLNDCSNRAIMTIVVLFCVIKYQYKA